MLVRSPRCKVPFLVVFVLLLGAALSFAREDPLVRTFWYRSDGMQVDGDIYFLNYYSLSLRGKVIIPMFIVTHPKHFYTDLSLYRISPDGSTGLACVWSFGPDISRHDVDLQTCRYGRQGSRLYFSWSGNWNSETHTMHHPVLEYDLDTGRGRVMDTEAPVEIDYRHPQKITESEVWGSAGLVPFKDWHLPSPLEYTSKDPRFLKKVLVEQSGDPELSTAAFAELDASGHTEVLSQILKEIENDGSSERREAYVKWEIIIRLSDSLRRDRPGDIFSVAYDNDVEAFKELLDAGADPNTADPRGRSLVMYAIFGGAPDTMTLLLQHGADPEQKTDCGQFPWLYASRSPLRQQFLKQWER